MSRVTISSRVLTSPLVLLLGPEPPSVTGGYSTYEMIDRPKRKSALDWKGEAPLEMTINLMLDGFSTDTSVEPQCRAIELLASPNRSKLIEPPPVKITGPIPHAELRWVVTGIEWLDVIYHSRGDRVRQVVNLGLTEYVRLRTIINNDIRKNKVRYRVVTVKKGYDLRQIAALMLGESSLWRRITNMKGKKYRDPYVKPGTRVKVPIQ